MAVCEKCRGTRRIRIEIPPDQLRSVDEPPYFMARCDKCDLWGYLDRDGKRRCGACTLQYGANRTTHPNQPHNLTDFVASAPPCECQCYAQKDDGRIAW